MTPPCTRFIGLACLVPALAAAQPASSPPRPSPPAAAPGPAQVVAAADADMGRLKADSERCIECHGPEGLGTGHDSGPEGKFPKLAGQHPDYLLKQLVDFRSGRRKHDVMGIMARSVEPEDLRDIVAFFAAQPRAGGDGAGDRADARQLFLQGDPARGVAACAACHGVAAQGRAGSVVVPAVPSLAGQQFVYLERQLLDWRSGWRGNSADGVMNQAARALTDAEIRQLAGFLSGLP